MVGKFRWPQIFFSLVLMLVIISFYPLVYLPTVRLLALFLCSHSMRNAVRTMSERHRSPAALEHRRLTVVLGRLAACAAQTCHLAPPEIEVVLLSR